MRVTSAVPRRRRHKRLLKRAKGMRGARSKVYRVAKPSVDRAAKFAYEHRRTKKRHFRRLWITRINAAARQEGLSYSTLMNGLRRAGVEIDRRQLSELAIHDPPAFKSLVDAARRAAG